ncbi:MAG TPA: efflux RND transporter periplasmic adaptor subunit, partial [Candidatus Paceibacterota bacterium]|nr:efflux RND transporter periplasmic adaptor subunit [Candidatus Paceibacterota bacterium]
SQQLALKQAGTSDEEIRAQEAAVEEARANVSSIRAQIGKTILRSPISGIITKKDFEVGEIVSANEPVLYVISDNNFEMEANVPEADIAKVDIGDAAKVTLDAYGPDVVFDSVVTKIDPAETMIEGVATYKTTLSFVKKDERVKSGMTANIDILTDKKEGVPAVPQRAVSAEDGERFVMLNTGGDTPEKRVIVVGLRGSDGYTEVLSGLVEGDKIVGLAE